MCTIVTIVSNAGVICLGLTKISCVLLKEEITCIVSPRYRRVYLLGRGIKR